MKNQYSIVGDDVHIYLNVKGMDKLTTIISCSDFEKVNAFPGMWLGQYKYVEKYYYCEANVKIEGRRSKISLHRFITDCPSGMVVDHINHNTLDNRRENLRVCTHSENQQNRKGAMKNNKCGIRGVSWNTKEAKWKAQICVQGKTIYLGAFTDIKDAEDAVIRGRTKYMTHSSESISV